MSQCGYCHCWYSNSIIDAHIALHERYRSTIVGIELDEYEEDDDFDPFVTRSRRKSSPEARPGIGYRGGQPRANENIEAKINEIVQQVTRMNTASDPVSPRTSQKSILKLTTLQGEAIKPPKLPKSSRSFRPAPTQRMRGEIRITCPACQTSVVPQELAGHKSECSARGKKRRAQQSQAAKQGPSLAS